MRMKLQDFFISSKNLKQLKVTWFVSTIGMVLFVTGVKISIWVFSLSFIFFTLAAICVNYIDKEEEKERLSKKNRDLQWRL